MRTLMITAALLIAAATTATLQTKYGVTVETDKNADLSRLKTYTWSSSQPALDKAADAQIVAAIDRELEKVGLQKRAAAPADVIVVYDSLYRTDVDLKAQAKDGLLPTYPVGTIAVRLLDPTSRQPLFRARIDKPISGEREKLESEINAAVTAIFEKYPVKPQPK